MRFSALAALLTGLVSLGCEGHPRNAVVSETVLPIVGGTVAATCVWPTAAMLVGPAGCSGTLVHPRVVVTAKHCLVTENGISMTPTYVGLGETSSQWQETVAISQCFTHPDNDFGFCTLAEDVTGVPIVPVMAPCEVSELAAGKPIIEAGFGVTSASSRTIGTKKWIGGTIESLASDQIDINVTTGSQDGEYYGDSGGPLFFPMPDGTWRLIGEDCCSPLIGSTTPRVSTYTSVPFHVAWAEQESGIDLTPCHDASGWNPTPACTGFPTNPGTGVGDWSTLCQGESLLRQPTCLETILDGGARDGQAEAGSQDAAKDGPIDAHSGDSDSGDGEPDSEEDGDIRKAANGDGSAGIRDGGTSEGSMDSGETGTSFPSPGPDSSAAGGRGGNAGASGGPAGTGGNDGDVDGSVGVDVNRADGGASTDGGSEAMGSGRPTDTSGISGRDAGPGSDAASASGDSGVSRTVFDGGVRRRFGRFSSRGCACRSVPDRDSGAWPIIGLLLVTAHLIRRRTRSRGRFVV